jgi:hypothetical protein
LGAALLAGAAFQAGFVMSPAIVLHGINCCVAHFCFYIGVQHSNFIASIKIEYTKCSDPDTQTA